MSVPPLGSSFGSPSTPSPGPRRPMKAPSRSTLSPKGERGWVPRGGKRDAITSFFLTRKPACGSLYWLSQKVLGRPWEGAARGAARPWETNLAGGRERRNAKKMYF